MEDEFSDNHRTFEIPQLVIYLLLNAHNFVPVTSVVCIRSTSFLKLF